MEEKKEMYVVVVVYNKNVNASTTLNKLKEIRSYKLNIIVVDNSTKNYGNSVDCSYNKWNYISMNGNLGLSKAYNAALDFINGKEGLVIWLDDDSHITQEYFDILQFESQTYPDVDIFVPVILGQDGKFWSPNEFRFFKNKQLKNINDNISQERFNAINSCTAVRTQVYKNYRYTEELFLDQVDHQFFEDQRKLGRKFKKMNIIINHNFSIRNKMKNMDDLKFRYSIMIPDYLTFCNKSLFRYMLGLIKIMGWGIREAFKYRSPIFLFWVIETVFKNKKRI